ncbi:MAG: hypothetical protein OXH57_12315, partial [Ekhidna sp.]|nr:hypothetical protein [Ekhidna sp.]
SPTLAILNEVFNMTLGTVSNWCVHHFLSQNYFSLAMPEQEIFLVRTFSTGYPLPTLLLHHNNILMILVFSLYCKHESNPFAILKCHSNE